MRTLRKTLFCKLVSISIFLGASCFATMTHAASFVVSNLNDTGAGSFRKAIDDANLDALANPGNISDITFTLPVNSTIPIGADFPLITTSMNINGTSAQGLILNGQAAPDGSAGGHVFFVKSGTGNPITVNLIALNIQNGLSKGGNGGNGVFGGGGAMGAGAAVFVNSDATVNFIDVSASGNLAKPGSAGGSNVAVGDDNTGGGGGGMLKGNGGNSANPAADGPGGGGGLAAAGGSGGAPLGAGNVGVDGLAITVPANKAGDGFQVPGAGAGGVGGASGGGGGGGTSLGAGLAVGGGGGGGISTGPGNDGALGTGGVGGDFGGGGGGGYTNVVGPGVNGSGGVGGFGGGGGGGATLAIGGLGGGNGAYGLNTAPTPATAGRAFGAAFFVRNGGIVSFTATNTSPVMAGNNLLNPVGGAVTGIQDLYLGGGNTHFVVPGNQTQNWGGGITDYDTDPDQKLLCPPATITKDGAGVFIFAANSVNKYRGGTFVNQGTLQGDFNSLQGDIINNSHVIFEMLAPAGAGTYGVDNGIQNAGIISGTGDVTVHGTPTNQVKFSSQNTYTGGTILSGGTLQMGIANALAPTGSVNISAATATLDLNGFILTIGDLTGSGNVQLGTNNTLTLGTSHTTEFTGVIQGFNSGIIKQGNGTLRLKGLSTYNGPTSINAGAIQVEAGGQLGGIGSNATIGTNLVPATLEMNGGSMLGSITGATPANSTLLITGNFTPVSPISNVGAVNISAGTATFTTGGVLPTGYNTISVSSAGEMLLNTDFTTELGKTINVSGASGKMTLGTGTLRNNATLVVNTGGLVQTTGGQTLINQATGEIKLGGGSISCAINGDPNSKLTVTASSSTANAISGISTIDVLSGATFTVADPVTGFTTFTTESGATTALTSSLAMGSGTLNVNGTLNMGVNTLSGIIGSVLNLNSTSFVNTGPIAGVKTINVLGGVFDMNTTPTNFTNITVANAAIMNLHSNLVIPVGSTVTTAGTLNMSSNNIVGTPNAQGALQINGVFATDGLISNVSTINVLGNGNFTMNTAPVGFSTFSTAAGSITTLNVDFPIPDNKIFTNGGTFLMNQKNITMGANASFANNGILVTNGNISGAAGYSMTVGNGGTLTVNNPITGYSTLSVGAAGVGTVILNSGGSLLNSITLGNQGIFTVNGGTFAGDISSGGQGAINVNGPFAPTGAVNVASINVNNGGTFRMINPITTTTGVNVNQGGTFYLNQNLLGGGTLTNAGLLKSDATIPIAITGNFVQTNAGTSEVALSETPGTPPGLTVSGTADIDGKLMVTLPNGGGSIVDLQSFPIIQTGGALTLQPSLQVVSTSSLLLKFVPVATANQLDLEVHMQPIENFVQDSEFLPLIRDLDGIRASGNGGKLADIFSTLDKQDTVAGLENVLSEILPEGLNGGTVYGTEMAQNLLPAQVFNRATALRAGIDNLKSGYAAGDMEGEKSSYGPMFLGNSMKQKRRQNMSGFTATTGGIGVLWDTPVQSNSRVGTAVSIASTTVRRDDATKNTTAIGSAQVMLYGSSGYGPLFIDGLASFGRNHYRGKRNIVSMGATASSIYSGVQYGGKVRGGFTVPFYSVEASPMASLHYNRLNIDQYNETGAPGENLAVAAMNNTNVRAELGVRIAEVSQSEEFLPEIHAMYIHDVKQADLLISARFLDAGGAFVSKGIAQPKSGINLGGSISTVLTDNMLISGHYDVEVKKSFVSHSASLKFRWLF